MRTLIGVHYVLNVKQMLNIVACRFLPIFATNDSQSWKSIRDSFEGCSCTLSFESRHKTKLTGTNTTNRSHRWSFMDKRSLRSSRFFFCTDSVINGIEAPAATAAVAAESHVHILKTFLFCLSKVEHKKIVTICVSERKFSPPVEFPLNRMKNDSFRVERQSAAITIVARQHIKHSESLNFQQWNQKFYDLYNV